MAAIDVEHFIEAQPENLRIILQTIRKTIKSAVPEAEELMSYQMPAFRFHGMLAWYATFKNHYSLFVPGVLSQFKEELKQYKLSKSGIRFPMDQPVPEDLIKRIVEFAARENHLKALSKSKRKK